jgi:hypothetical protein
MSTIITIAGIAVILSAIVFVVVKVIRANEVTKHDIIPPHSCDYEAPSKEDTPVAAPPAFPFTVSIMASRLPRMYFGNGPTMELNRASYAKDYTVNPAEKVFVELEVFATNLRRAFNWGQTDQVRMRVNDLGDRYVAAKISASGNTRVDDSDACGICACTFDGVNTALWMMGAVGQKVLNRIVFEFSFDGGKTWGFACEACVYMKR